MGDCRGGGGGASRGHVDGGCARGGGEEEGEGEWLAHCGGRGFGCARKLWWCAVLDVGGG